VLAFNSAKGDRMKKMLTTLVFATPSLALAQAPAVPTLDKILEASGITMTGYIDAAYTHANRDIEGGNFSPRVFDSYNNSFVLHQVGLQIAKQPKQGAGGLVNVTAGRDATIIHSSPDTSASTFDITQGYLQYAIGSLTVIGGKFTTLHGAEVIWSPGNVNYSRSILFGAEPFTHTGLRATYALSDSFSLIGGINNGWDQLVDLNKGKTLELGVTAAPIKPLSLAASYYGGQEPSAVSGATGRRDSFDFTATWKLGDPLSVGLEYLRVSQEDAVPDGAGGTRSATYSGIAGYLSWTFMPKMRLSLRAEAFDDKDGFRFPVAAAVAGTTGTKHREFTTTVAWLAADNFELRGEVRADRADQSVYSDGGGFSKTLTTFALQGLYKF
jgi:hypothetical protein